ncbi:ATP-binding protein [Phyllobacterium sophorae]|nr:ATP-binding protein [Phyllobacterium sophorae]
MGKNQVKPLTEGAARDERSLDDLMMELNHHYYGRKKRDDLLKAEVERLRKRIKFQMDAASGSLVGEMAEGRILALLGESGAGKTRSLTRIFKKFPELLGKPEAGRERYLISIKAPSPCLPRLIAERILRAVGYPIQKELAENVAWNLVTQYLPACGVRLVHIDEFQHVSQRNDALQRQKVRDSMKDVMQIPDFPVSFVVSGLPEIAEFLQPDRQIKRRTRTIVFHPLSYERDRSFLETMISNYVCRAGIEADFGGEFVKRLIHAASSQTGIFIEYLLEGIEQALLLDRNVLDNRCLEDVYAIRSGCLPDQNVFTAKNWRSIDVEQSIGKYDDSEFVEWDDVDIEEDSDTAAKPRVRRNS